MRLAIVRSSSILLGICLALPAISATLPAPKQHHRIAHKRSANHHRVHRKKRRHSKSHHQGTQSQPRYQPVKLGTEGEDSADKMTYVFTYPYQYRADYYQYVWPKRHVSRRGIYYYSERHYLDDFTPKMLKQFDHVSYIVEPDCRHGLPTPHDTKRFPKVLSLREAIFLTLRNNPTVIGVELDRVTQKFALEVARNAFEPQYALSMSATSMVKGVKPSFGLTSSVDVKSTIGTDTKLSYSNSLGGQNGVATLSITQPLMKGFGAVNLLSYKDALDTEQSNRLSFKNTVMTTVDSVTTKYRTVVKDENQLEIQLRTLASTKKALSRYKLRVKVGKMAPSELLQQESLFATTKLSTVTQENQNNTDYQDLLKEIGIDPASKLHIVRKISFPRYRIPKLKWATCRALSQNIAYRQAVIAMRATERSIQTAKDARKPSLDLTLTGTLGKTRAFGSNITTDSEVSPTAGLTLTIPIDDLATKQSLVSSRIALEKAKLNLMQTKENLIRSVQTQLQTLKSDQEQIKISETAVKIQRMNLKASEIKQRYGRTQVFDVTQIQDQLLSQETSMVTTQITYLNDITTLDNLLNITLKHWRIKLRY